MSKKHSTPSNQFFLPFAASSDIEDDLKQTKETAEDARRAADSDRNKESYRLDRENRLAKVREYRKANKDKIAERDRSYAARHKDKLASYKQQHHQRLKYEVLSHYSGGVPRCACCEQTDIRALSIDHIVAVGNAKTRRINLAAKLKREGFPLGYQVLCMSCQFVKRHENRESQKQNARDTNNARASRKLKERLKLKVFLHYCGTTPKCKHCGLTDIRALSIDHVDGGGRKHRAKIGYSTSAICREIIRAGYPECYQVLCMSCQFIKRHENNEVRRNHKR